MVDVSLSDMGGAMMRGPGRAQRHDGRPITGRSRGMGNGAGVCEPGCHPGRTVSLRVVNQGAATQELIVLSLPAGQTAEVQDMLDKTYQGKFKLNPPTSR